MNDLTHSRGEVNRSFDSFGIVIFLRPNLQCSFFNLHFPVFPLERLRETKLNLALMQAVVCREWRAGIQILRNQKLRRIQKISLTNRQCATQRSLDAKAEAVPVTPAQPQRSGIYDSNGFD